MTEDLKPEDFHTREVKYTFKAPTYCPKHHAPQANGVMIGGIVWECGCALISQKP